MANYTLIQRPGTLLASQANSYLAQVLSDLAQQNIQSHLELIGAVATAFQGFYGNLGLPLHVPLVFAGIPLAQSWNQYQRQLSADIATLYQQTAAIESAAARALLFSQIENSMLSAAVDVLANHVSAFNATRPTTNGLRQFIVSDNFQDTSKIDLASTTALVANKTVQLARSDEQEFSSNVTLWIDDDYVQAALGAEPSGTDLSTGGSNGFPGNLHEVTVPENTNPLTGSTSTSALSQAVQLNAQPGQTIAFVGDAGLHADLGAVLDGDPSTWFEYEVCNIPDALKLNPALGYGFEISVPQLGPGSPRAIPWYAFHEGTNQQAAQNFFPPLPSTTLLHPAQPEVDAQGNFTAVGNTVNPLTAATTLGGNITLLPGGAPQTGGVLRLVLLGELHTPQTLTEISLTFNVLNNKRPVVRAVQVRSDDNPSWVSGRPMLQARTNTLTSVSQSTDLGETPEVWSLPPMLVHYVRIVIEQPQSYSASIGHLVWVEQTTNSLNPALLNALLGMSIALNQDGTSTPSYARVDGPNPSLMNALAPNTPNVISTIEGVAAYLPGNGEAAGNSQLIGPLIEAYDGWRYAIAIRDISFQAITYQATSTLVSRDFAVPLDIKRIQLQASEAIPQVQGSGEWISYEISLDGGGTWLPIAPQTHYTSTAPRSYTVNQSAIALGSTPVATPGYDPIRNPASSVRLRATLTRPSSAQTATPSLESYSLLLEGIPL